MELGLEKKIINRYETVFCRSTVHEENTEMIVPDHSPDILRIVKGSANAFLKDKSARDGKLDVSGTIKGAVLYVAEGEKNIRKLDVTMPFAYVIDAAEITPESKIHAHVVLRALDIREINPRKVSVRASVEVNVSAFEEKNFELCANIADSEKYGICMRKKAVSAYRPVIVREKAFSVSDDIELSSAESEMSDILIANVSLTPSDTKVIGNKSILKGNANISFVYALPDGHLECGEYELPFSQIIDIDGMETENDLKISLSVSGFELEPQYDASGKARYLTVSAVADASVIVLAADTFDVIDDVYSTKHEMSVKHDTVKCTRFYDRCEKRVAITESVETGVGIKQVLDVEVNLMPPVRRREEGGEVLASDAAISVMYVGDDDGIYSASRRAAVVCPVPLNGAHSYEASCDVRGKNFSIGANNEINVRFFTDFDITETEEISVPAILQIDADTENVRSSSDSPSITVKRLEKERDIWSLAKEYATTVEEIKLANNISDEACLTVGRMVLIPKAR
ncbi:MAG: DUF3794 domain-containing protein [Oscillospiraceae bacterium]|nr:DUF3794 domain-containing protein [Oscillospiraceae bacterium]